MTISLKVPEDDHSSLSGVSYAGKTVVLQYSDGIDIYNSPGFPMWCLNRESGNLKEPFVDEWGYTSCVNWTKYEQDCMSMSYGSPGGTYQYDAGMSGGGGSDSCDYSVFNYELFPDILPEIHWEGHDNMNRKWGLKPREKTVVYTKIGAGNCTQSFTNPLADDIDDGYTAQRELEKKGATFRQEVASLLDWYRANKERDELVRVHTGKLVGEAALLAEQNGRPPARWLWLEWLRLSASMTRSVSHVAGCERLSIGSGMHFDDGADGCAMCNRFGPPLSGHTGDAEWREHASTRVQGALGRTWAEGEF